MTHERLYPMQAQVWKGRLGKAGATIVLLASVLLFLYVMLHITVSAGFRLSPTEIKLPSLPVF